MESLLSIIVPVYNAEKYLSLCIESILQQTWTNFELILINDGSTDDSMSVCRLYAERDNRIIVIDKENEGVSIARNTGISVAKGNYIGFVDSDDIIEPQMYEILIQYLEKYSEVQFVTYIPRMVFENGTFVLPVEQEIKEIVYSNIEYRKLLYLEKTNVACWSKLFKSEFLKSFKFPEKRVNEDFFMLQEMTKSNISILSVNDVLYNYMVRDGSLSSVHSSRKDAVDNALFCLKFEENSKEGIVYEAQALFFIQCDYYFDKLIKENRRKENREYLNAIKKELRQHLIYILRNEYLYGKQKMRLIRYAYFY